MTGLHVDTLSRGFEPLGDMAQRYLDRDPGWRFQLVVHVEDTTVVDMHSGDDYDSRTIHMQASATKGVAGIALALALESAGVDVDVLVSSVWPEFAVRGKARITVGELLSHQAGLVGFSRTFPEEAVGEGRLVAADLAQQRPRWAPGKAHGYHALTIGPLADELVHRLTGTQLWEFYEQRIRAPSAIDFWIRLPASQTHRIGEVRVPSGAEAEAPTRGEECTTASIADEAVHLLDSYGRRNSWINSRRLVAAGVPSVSGTGSARGLADSYASALGVGGRPRLLHPETLAMVSQLQTLGPDLVLGRETRFATMFQKPGPGLDFGTADAFGHDGAGGALGFGDPKTHVAFGYVTGQVPTPAGADRRALAFAQQVRRQRLCSVP